MAPPIHPSYRALVQERACDDRAFSLAGRVFTFAEIHQALLGESVLGVTYARAVATQMFTYIAAESNAPIFTSIATIRIDVSALQCAIDQYRSMPQEDTAWTTMSNAFTVAQMAEGLQARKPDALCFFSDVMRVSRDAIGRRRPQHARRRTRPSKTVAP